MTLNKDLLKYITVIMSVILLISFFSVPSTNAYLTNKTDAVENKFTIALDVTSKIVEKYPTQTPTISDDGTQSLVEKSIQVVNTGYVDEYVRVKIVFSDSTTENLAYFSNDGTNYYSVSEYQSLLSSVSSSNPTYAVDDDGVAYAWVYNSSDGYYYYTKILEAGDYLTLLDVQESDSDTSYTTYFDETYDQYYYKDSSTTILVSEMITTTLFRYVKVIYAEASDLNSYGIHVYSESCPYYLGSDYASAWEAYTSS